ncbi:MAG: AAA family ATPase, partial [Dehalococcoidia bacterium]
MAIQERVVPDKLAARRLIETALERAGIKHRELAGVLYLSRGAVARELGVRYPDRFTEHELQTLATFLDLAADQRDHLLRSYGYAEGPPRPAPQGASAPVRDSATITSDPEPGVGLPVPLTSFVGRQWERATTKRLLAITRLLTLTGAGGIGKTRLALEVAREVAPYYRDGVHWVDLSALGDGAGVMPAIAAALGLRDNLDRTMLDVVRDALRSHEALLVLDNCEHLLDASAVLTESLLGSCPALAVLATSREPIGAAGEMLWRVPSLSVPPDPTGDPEAAVAESESVR